MKKILINAPVFYMEQNNIPVFQELRREIHKHDIEAVIPSFEINEINPNKMDDFIKLAAKRLLDCDAVVTHGNWYDFHECVRITEIARLLNIPVVHHIRLSHFLMQQNDFKNNNR